MKYIAALDYAHLDNGVFLASVGRALAQQQDVRPIIVHGESEYTERLIQTGIPRKQATVHCIKNLNHRLVALFADQGVATIGINGYQRKLITLNNDKLGLDHDYFNTLPSKPVLLLSTLVLNSATNKPEPVKLAAYLDFLNNELSPDEVFVFSKEDYKKSDFDPSELMELMPDDLKSLTISARMATTSIFDTLPDLKGFQKIIVKK